MFLRPPALPNIGGEKGEIVYNKKETERNLLNWIDNVVFPGLYLHFIDQIKSFITINNVISSCDSTIFFSL